MASMSYCMFENTSIEMSQVVNSMDESYSWEDLDLSQYEQDAKEKLYMLCKRYIRNYDRLNCGDTDEG